MMSGAGSPSLTVNAPGARVAVIASSWHEEIMAALVESALRTATNAGATAEVFQVPGSFELPLAAQAAARAGFDAVIALGVVIRGGTPHFEFVCDAATSGLNRVALDSGVPIGFGLLTCDTEQQARDRAGLPGSPEDKGAEACEAALAMIGVLDRIGAARVES
jgi:6,7-dimethyl-8-ribityllumazine synthase